MTTYGYNVICRSSRPRNDRTTQETIDFEISDRAKDAGVTRMGIVGNSILVVYKDITIKADYNGNKWYKTEQAFERAAEKVITEMGIIQLIVTELTSKWNELQKAKPETIPELESELTAIYHFKSLKDTDDIYYWDKDKGIYLKDAEWLIKQECIRLDPEFKTFGVTDVMNHIIWSNYIDRKELDEEIEWLSCKNCMINLRTLETRPHDPEFLTTVQIPHEYRKDQQCPKIMEFLNEVMAPEDVETVLDFFSYCLWRGFPFHKYLLFNGSGRNGKGVTIDILKTLLGRDNISGESLKRLLENRFAAAKLFGKMANIDADLSKDTLTNTGLLKKLTGGDDIPAEHKFKAPFSFVNYAKLVFSANQIPKTPDETDAFFARLIIINFPNQYLGEKADPWLIRKLTTKDEMEGLLSILISRLPKVLDKGIHLPHSSIEENYTKYIQSSDPIKAFVDNSTDRDSNNVLKTELYDTYVRFCKDKALSIESSQSFSRILKKDHDFLDKQVRVGGRDNKFLKYWIGVKVVDYRQVEEGQDTL